MNRDETKTILLLHRPGPAEAADPQIAEALARAECDPELKDWLARQGARQLAVREQFRRITAPAGLKEQIISEQAAKERMTVWRRKVALAALAAAVVLVASASFWFSRPGPDDTLAVYQNQMAGVALRGYAMDVATNDPAAVRAYLARHRAPADFVLPEKLQQLGLAGCAVEGWQDARVAMICFRTRQAPPEVAGDVWLFVVDRTAVKKSTVGSAPQFSKVNRLMTATWVQGDKLYFLGTTGDAQTIQHCL